MLQVSDLTIAYDAEDTLFSEVTFHVSPGEHVALVGPNGAGKSSLLKLISGELLPTGGSAAVTSGRTVAYLPQDSYVPPGHTLHDEMLSVFADVLAIEERQREVEREMSGLEGEALNRVLEEYSRLQADFDRLNGYTIEREVGTVLHGLGFTPNDTGRQVAHFSGGWQSRIALGKVLLKRPDLLLLDEPTNHLDLSATEWLEEYLSKYNGALLIVSHDRYFLERATTRTLELEQSRLTDYPGRYSWYVAEKERRREAQQEAYERQQLELGRQQAFIDRFRAKPTKASAAKSREKMVARVERLEAPPPDGRKVKFRFPFFGNSGREVLRLKNISRTYGDRTIFRDVDLLVERGDKIAVIGPNGSGKSTLMRLMAGVDEPSAGSVSVGHNVRRSYFEQHQAELLDLDHSVYDEVMRSVPKGWTVTDVRNLLGRFLFTGDDVRKPIEVLSGGERSRVALVKMLLEPANTLLLDEPTNHLDIPSRDMLETAIRDYEGACLVISHDRYFLDRIATKTLDIEDGRVTLYPGAYSEYRDRKLGVYSEPEPAPRKPEPKQTPRNAEKDLRRLRQEVATLEREIAQSEERLSEVQNSLSDPELYSDLGQYSAMLGEYGELQGRLEDLNGRWEHSASRLDSLEPSDDRSTDLPARREQLVERLRELDSILEDPDAYADDDRCRALMDEYAEVYEALAGLPPDQRRSAPGQPQRAAGQSPVPRTGEVESVQARLAEVERMLMDPELYLDEARSVPILDEYGYLQEKLQSLTAGGRRR